MEDMNHKTMKVFDRIDALKEQFKSDCLVRKNGTLILGPGKIPNCKHMLFKPLEENLLKENLIDQYKLAFPQTYAAFLRVYNGMNLFGTRIIYNGIALGSQKLCVFGLPLTPTSCREDAEEPYDVRLMGLDGHKDLPRQWFMFGSYKKSIDKDCCLYIDTDNGRIYGCERRKTLVVDEWDNFDACLCDMFNRYADLEDEYIFNAK